MVIPPIQFLERKNASARQRALAATGIRKTTTGGPGGKGAILDQNLDPNIAARGLEALRGPGGPGGPGETLLGSLFFLLYCLLCFLLYRRAVGSTSGAIYTGQPCP